MSWRVLWIKYILKSFGTDPSSLAMCIQTDLDPALCLSSLQSDMIMSSRACHCSWIAVYFLFSQSSPVAVTDEGQGLHETRFVDLAIFF